jgi:hypothetical protein
VLAHLARLCREALDAYPTTLEQDIAALAAPVTAEPAAAGVAPLPYGSNARNVRVLVKGEKEVCAYYIALHAAAAELAAMPVRTSGVQGEGAMAASATLPRPTCPQAAEAAAVVAARFPTASDRDRYMRGTFARVLRRQVDEDRAAAATASLAAAGAGATGTHAGGLGAVPLVRAASAGDAEGVGGGSGGVGGGGGVRAASVGSGIIGGALGGSFALGR